IWASMWVWPSTKPGATTWPSASRTSRACSRMRPIETILPWRTPTSARKRGSPEPSITVPFLITRSYAMSDLSFSRGTLAGFPLPLHLQLGLPVLLLATATTRTPCSCDYPNCFRALLHQLRVRVQQWKHLLASFRRQAEDRALDAGGG